MLTSDLDYHLPPELIAQHPVIPRDRSRMLVYNRATGQTSHRRLTGLPAALHPGDLLVFNDSRVIRARVFAAKPTGGRVELLFLRRQLGEVWEALVKPSARLQPGMRLTVATGESTGRGNPPAKDEAPGAVPRLRPGAGRAAPETAPFTLREHLGEGRWLVENDSGMKTEDLLELVGVMPLPPYIKERLADPDRYQTVYAAKPGSAAAPTAGLHFTPQLIENVKAAGIGMAPLTLHVGLDTFRPVSEADLALHRIHRESYSVPPETYQEVLATRMRGGRVLAVGTTAVRVLETVFGRENASLAGETDLFITPGYRFRAVDALLTNFHLPRSTLLALVMSFAGVHETRRLYRQAIALKYRFFSFGDAMLIL